MREAWFVSKGKSASKKVNRMIISTAILLIAVVICVILAVGACSDKNKGSAVETTVPTTAPTTSAPAATSAAPTETEQEPAAVIKNENPLTGLEMADEKALGQRPVSLMINNIKVATPQIGVSEADLLFEMEVEAGITRMMAMFADVRSIPEIGSIRSARHDYIDLCGGFDAILVHMGGSYLAVDQFQRQKTDHFDGQVHFSAFWRDNEWRTQRGYEHSVRTTGENLDEGIKSIGLRTEIKTEYGRPFVFRQDLQTMPAGDLAADYVKIPYSSYVTTELDYDNEQQLYLKSQFGSPHLDIATGKALAFTNVLILQTNIGKLDHKLSEIDLSSGKGYYISGGKAEEITWSKGETDDMFEFKDSNDEKLVLNRGKSYIAIVSDRQKIVLE
jgi:hypothetical protein